MGAHSVFRSPPAVAGLIFLALVVGTIFAVRSTMSDDGDTDVAGTVIERSEEPGEFVETPQDEPREPIIVRPRPDRQVAQDEPARQAAPAPAPIVPVDPVDEQVGLIRDEPAPVVVVPDADADTTPRQPRRDGERDPDPVDPRPDPQPDPEPDPEPTRRPAPKPDPEPEPEPKPEPDTTQYELREGDGISEDTARSEDPGNSGKYNWEFVSLASHDNQDGATARSRKAMARLFVGFSEATTASNDPVRDFRCDALVTAGSRRLITDRDHFFEIQLWTTDGYALQDLVSSVFVRQALDLAPGEQRTLKGTTVQDQQAAEGLNYTCTVEYRER